MTSPNALTGIISRHCANHATRNDTMKTKTTYRKTCENCGIEYQTECRNQVNCGLKCMAEWRTYPAKKCGICRELFEPRSSVAKTCDSCKPGAKTRICADCMKPINKAKYCKECTVIRPEQEKDRKLAKQREHNRTKPKEISSFRWFLCFKHCF